MLRNPIAVFQDLERQGEGRSICVVALPKARIRSDGAEVPLPSGVRGGRFGSFVSAPAIGKRATR